MKVQEAWDRATNAYSRYPSFENWQTFLDCKERVLRMREILEQSASSSLPTSGLSTSEKIYDLLKAQQKSGSSEMCEKLMITKDQLRHGLIKLLKEDKIEKIKTGLYKIKP